MQGPVVLPLSAPPLAHLLHALRTLPHVACFEIDQRYTAVVADPLATFATDGAFITTTIGRDVRIQIDNPFDALQRFATRFPALPADPYLPFYAGLVGCVSFEWGARTARHAEHPVQACSALPESWFGWYDTAVVLDRREGNAYIASLGLRDGAPNTERARRRIDDWLQRIADAAAYSMDTLDGSDAPAIPASSQYVDAAHGAVRLLQQGVAERVNFATCYQRILPLTPLDAFLRTRTLHPTHAAMFLDIGSHQLCASAPGKLLGLRERTLALHPILATGPHMPARSADEWLAHTPGTIGLHHRMAAEIAPLLVDGSLQTPAPHLVADRHFAHVVAPIVGELDPAYTMIDALATIVPGLSMTGSPKPAALRLLTHCEPVRRNAYTGAMGFIGANRRAQFSMSVRLLTMRDQLGTVHAANWLTPQSDAGAHCEQSHHAVQNFFHRLERVRSQTLAAAV